MSKAMAQVTRMTPIMLHARRPAEESWIKWHRRTWLQARPMLTKTWGEDPVPTVIACAVGAVAVVGRTLRWRSAADVSAMRTIAGGRFGAWHRCRAGRPRRRWEDPWAEAAGEG